MNYRHVYMLIIEHAKSEQKLGLRPLSFKDKKQNFSNQYFEFHHILPRSLFPSWTKKKSNIVPLTAREHFFCHQLLIKIYPGKKMSYALWAMICDKRWKYTSRDYQKAKENYSKFNIGGKSQKGIKNPNKGHPQTEEQKRATSIRSTGNTNTKGRKWYTNGIIDKMLFECPNGWYLGRSKTKGKEAWNKGKHLSKEQVEKFKIAINIKIKSLTQEERKLKYGSRRGLPAWNRGKKASLSAREKMSKAQKKRFEKHPELRKRVSEYSSKKIKELNSGIIFNSLHECAQYYNHTNSWVLNRISFERDGLQFKYI